MSQWLGVKNEDKHSALQNVSILYTWKNIRKHCENNKLKIRAPTYNNAFELPDRTCCVSDIQDYTECIIKKIRLDYISFWNKKWI